MVLRCYSRRHLVPASRALQRHISTAGPSAAAHAQTTPAQHASNAASSSQQRASASDEQQGSWSFFFPAHLRWQRPPSASRARHPLVKKLISEIYSTSRVPDANRVWKAYMDLKESYDVDVAGSSTAVSNSLLTQLDSHHLQHLLRAIDPSVATTRKLSRAESKRRQTVHELQTSSTTGNAPTKILLVEPHSSRHSTKVFTPQNPVREYMRRVQIIFRDMRLHSYIMPSTSSTVDALPSLADYNHVLSRLASGGHIGPMSSIWNEINGLSRKGDSKGLYPNGYTYKELMVGLSRHSTEQIERVQKGEASKTFDYSGKKKQLEKSARAAAAGLARFGQVLAPSARAAAILAALRTMALLKDMKDHAVTPDQITLDFAARTLRLAGHIDGLHLLMQQAYGIDLASPDTADATQRQSGVSPTTHTLNTILMALGEQATVPEMVAAFETLAKPIPVNSTHADASSSGEGVFSTNWKDIFSSMRNRDAEMAQQGGSADDVSVPDVFPYTYPHRISPNTKTLQILLRHCCSEVDPLRSPVALKTEGTSSSVATIAKESTELALAEMQDGGPRAAEMDRRKRGTYTLFARSLISEALDRSDELLRLTARNLGIELERTEPVAAAAETQSISDETELASDGSHGAAESARVRPEYLRVSAVPGRAMDADFLPVLEPPSFSITAEMIEPFYSLASYRRDFGNLHWMRSALSKALENKAAEAQVIDAAYRVYNARFAKARRLASEQSPESKSEISSDDFQDLAPLRLQDQKPTEVYNFLHRLRQQHKLAARQAQALDQLLYDRLDDRLRDLKLRRTNRQMQRALSHREARLKAEQQKLEEEEREVQRKKQVAEVKRLRALQKEEQQSQQASVDNASSQHLEAASTATA